MSACDSDAPAEGHPERSAQTVFWLNLARLCGQAYAGRIVQAPAGDSVLTGQSLVMHVRECGPDEVRIPFHVGEDRSRTWVLTRTDSSLALEHEHRHEDGSDARATGYGGVTAGPGSTTTQRFPAETRTIEANPRVRTNVWTIVLERSRFTYRLDRLGTDRRFRIDFDLTDTVPTPPPPWGRRVRVP